MLQVDFISQNKYFSLFYGVVSEMALRGVKIDLSLLSEGLLTLKVDQERLSAKFDNAGNILINNLSWKCLYDVLFWFMGGKLKVTDIVQNDAEAKNQFELKFVHEDCPAAFEIVGFCEQESGYIILKIPAMIHVECSDECKMNR